MPLGPLATMKVPVGFLMTKHKRANMIHLVTPIISSTFALVIPSTSLTYLSLGTVVLCVSTGRCTLHRAVVVKTIRADVGIGGEDAIKTGGLHIIHLVRDPRAVIHSQIKTFNVAHKYRRYFHGPASPEESAAGSQPGFNTTQVCALVSMWVWVGVRVVCALFLHQHRPR